MKHDPDIPQKKADPNRSSTKRLSHDKEHRVWSRRHFLRTAGLLGSAAFTVGNLPVTPLAASPLTWALSNSNTDRIIVLIRLKGGNDGLNMIVPIQDYGSYLALRPKLAIPERQIIPLSTTQGMTNIMQGLEKMWQDGQMKIVNSVGYPDHNLSHFRSSDIWATASDPDVTISSGWLGRWLDREYPNFLEKPPENPPAIQIGGSGSLLLQNNMGLNMGITVNDPNELTGIAQNGALYNTSDVPECYYGEQLTFLRTVANNTFRYAGVLADAFQAGKNEVEYEWTLGNQLALIARMIKGGLGTQLYMVTLDGFDTHARQSEIHPRLMNQLNSAITAFYQDLMKSGDDQRVLTMTHSEFGRRPEQNASGGTDHGAAAPLLLFGPGLEGNGFVGTAPDLKNLDVTGNIPHAIDFRQVYATLLEGWLCVENSLVDTILGQQFDRLAGLGLACSPTAVHPNLKQPTLKHWANTREGILHIHYLLDQRHSVSIQVFTMLGQLIATRQIETQWPGEHKVSFHLPPGLARGHFVYRINAGIAQSSGKVSILSR